MNEPLKQGDSFFLPDGVFVNIGDYCIESGRVYDFPEDRSHIRARLKKSLTRFLHDQEVKHDPDIVERFVNFIAKDVPTGTVRLPSGTFVVDRIEPLNDNNEIVYCHRVGDQSDRMHYTQNKAYGHAQIKGVAE